MLLRQEAINAAKNANWQQAITLNQEILKQNSHDLEAMNRLGLAQLKIGQPDLAKKTFKQILTIAPTSLPTNT